MEFIDFRLPAKGFDTPLSLWRASHERGQRVALLLQRLAEHWRINGPGDAASTTARDVRRFFEEATPRHHEDEDVDLFPRVLRHLDQAAGSDGKSIAEALDRLHRDHEVLDAQWREAREALDHCMVQPPRADEPIVINRFVDSYIAHHGTEDELILPIAQLALPATEFIAIGESMAARRATTWSALGQPT